MPKKLNKNQKRFFEMAISHFGIDKSKELMLKQLRAYADDSGLILPTTFLQKHCKIRRGWFDLTKSGVIPEVEDKENSLDEFVENPIKEVSIYGDVPDTRTTKKKKEDAMRYKDMPYRNPVYVVVDDDKNPIAVMDSFETAWAKRIVVLHDHGSIDKKEAEKIIEIKHFVIIQSSNSTLACTIFKMDLNV